LRFLVIIVIYSFVFLSTKLVLLSLGHDDDLPTDRATTAAASGGRRGRSTQPLFARVPKSHSAAAACLLFSEIAVRKGLRRQPTLFSGAHAAVAENLPHCDDEPSAPPAQHISDAPLDVGRTPFGAARLQRCSRRGCT